LTTAQTTALTTAEMRAMTTTQMQGITINDIAVLTTTQVAALTTCGLTALQTQAFSVLVKTWIAASGGYTPIVLDLNGNGITTLAMADGVQFDLLASGQPVQTGWVAPGDGLLVRDLNSDGIINNGTELFGNATVLADGSTASDGYQALADLDSNHDGVISKADVAFSQVGVWVDGNSDGISEAGEVYSLAELGITEISVQAQLTATQDHGNKIGLTSTFKTSDGVSHVAGDVWFTAQDALSYAAALSMTALRTDQVSALDTGPTEALPAVGVVALQTQAISALGVADGPLSLVVEHLQDHAATLTKGLAQRASALTQAIGTFDIKEAQSSAITQSLNLPVDSYGEVTRLASLVAGNLVDQLRTFDSRAGGVSAGQASLTTAAPPAVIAMQVASVGLLNPLKNSLPIDLTALSGNNLPKP